MASDASALANTPRDSSMREEEGDRETNARRNDTSSPRSARTKGTLAGTRSVFFFSPFLEKEFGKIKFGKKLVSRLNFAKIFLYFAKLK
jgi:hypothetical protein